MQLSKNLLVLALLALSVSAPLARAQATAESDDGNSDGVENDGGRPGAENDGNDGDDTSIGANPPNALIGCLSPYTYVDSQEGLELAKGLIDASGLEEVLKYRNTSGTFFVPSNNALRNLAAATGVDIDEPNSISAPLIRSLIQYHLLFDTIDPTTLASLQTATPYDTTLYLSPDGSNGGLGLTPQQVLVRQPGVTYSNVTLTVSPLPAGATAENAPNGTYKATAGSSAGNLIWDATNEPVRTCVGYIYKIDGVLVPASTLQALSTGALAPAPGEAESDDGAGADAPGQASDDGGDVANEGSSEGSEGEASSDGGAAVGPAEDDDSTASD